MDEVRQEDREAAAKVAVLVEMRELILAGRADHHAEPFASHRIAAERRIVEWLRDDAQTCNCFAYSEDECACGAWGVEPGERSYKQAYIEDVADAIERGEHLAKLGEQP